MIRLSTGTLNLLCGALGFSAIFDYSHIDVYSGAQPSSADAAVGGAVLLGAITKDGAAFVEGTNTNGLRWGTPSSGIVHKNTDVWQFKGVAAGVAGWFRLKANAADGNALSTALPRVDGSIGNSGANLNFTNLTIASGMVITIDDLYLQILAQGVS